MMYREHVKQHKSETYTCEEDDCGKQYETKIKLRDHIRCSHGYKTLCGCGCGQSFSNKSNLSRHLETKQLH